jgi:glycosyltransferase involved in cell wall biosynthesis
LWNPALVYANSIGSARVIEELAPEVPVLTHVHELEYMFRGLAGAPLERLMARTRNFIACSEAVRQNLIRTQGVAPAHVKTVHASLPVEQIRAQRTREQTLEELGIPSDASVVVGCGTINWIKGPDLFVQVARDVCQRRPRVHFVWVGGGVPLDRLQFEHDIRLTGLSEKIHLTGPVKQAADYLAAAEIFLLTSRSDSYPLACLEAAALQKPLVCFADTGGMPEFIGEDCGFVVPPLDVGAMVDRTVSLLDSPDLRLTMGTAARGKVMKRHDTNLAALHIVDIIERTIAGSSAACDATVTEAVGLDRLARR